MKKVIMIGLISSVLFACQTQENNVNVPNPKEAAQEGITKQEKVIEETIDFIKLLTVGFGAFKTTEKLEVKGWFKDFNLNFSQSHVGSWSEQITGATIGIDVNSLETNNNDRNAKIIRSFFGKTSSNDQIKGSVKEVNLDSAIVNIEIDFNGVKKEVLFGYETQGDTLNFTSTIQLEDFGAEEALAAMNKACEGLHKGSDGVSKTWSEVKLYLTAVKLK